MAPPLDIPKLIGEVRNSVAGTTKNAGPRRATMGKEHVNESEHTAEADPVRLWNGFDSSLVVLIGSALLRNCCYFVDAYEYLLWVDECRDHAARGSDRFDNDQGLLCFRTANVCKCMLDDLRLVAMAFWVEKFISDVG
jgi:hypothetical protein